MTPTEKQVAAYLDEKGFKHSLLGFKYLIKAILLCSTGSRYLDHITKSLYPTVAKAFNTKNTRAERAIRHSIETCTLYAHGIKPNNSEFIACAVDYFKYEEE